MARKEHRPQATHQQMLIPQQTHCPTCGGSFWVAYRTRRTILTLEGLCQLTLSVRRCQNQDCSRYHVAYRPEEEGRWALPHGEFWLDVIALIGTWRFAEHRSVPEIHQRLQSRSIQIAERPVLNLVQRYEELVALHLSNQQRLDDLLSS